MPRSTAPCAGTPGARSGSSTKCSTAPTAEMFPGDGSLAHAQEIRSHLAGCGVSVAQQTVRAGALSGGQRSRVALAAVSFSRPHLLVLDEPTNHLELEAVAALPDAVHRCLRGRSGMLPSGSCALLRTAKSRSSQVLVSHEQDFVQRVAREVHIVEGGKGASDGVLRRL